VAEEEETVMMMMLSFQEEDAEITPVDFSHSQAASEEVVLAGEALAADLVALVEAEASEEVALPVDGNYSDQ